MNALDIHAEDGFGAAQNLFGRLRQFDASGLAPPADVDLSLNHDRVTPQPLGDFDGLFGRLGNLAAGGCNTAAAQDLFGLVFVDFHLRISPASLH